MNKPPVPAGQRLRNRLAAYVRLLSHGCFAVIALLCANTVMSANEPVDRHALLVGVSDYPNFDARYRLEGPRNDVALMYRVLRERGFPEQRVSVLADGILGDRKPTRDAILRELKRLAEITGKSSYVYLHFSGHGSRQPSPIPSSQREPDGMDELILPYDAANWNKSLGTVDNAIIDDELQEAIDAIRGGGTFVWAVFDSCHSGSVTRAFTPPKVRERRVPESVLGIPAQRSILRSSSDAISRGRGAERTIFDAVSRGQDGLGGLVTFFASQPYEKTLEQPLPGDSSDARIHGLFTYTLASILSKAPDVSYSQAAQAILQRYAQERWRPTPLFWGSDLDAQVFGTAGGQQLRQWPLERHGQMLLLGAGRLHGIVEGTLLAVVRTPAAEAQQAIAYVEVTNARMLDSFVRPIPYKGRPAPAAILFWPHTYARVERPSLSLALTVSRPPPSPHPDDARVRRLLSRASADATNSGMTLKVRWVDPDESADVRLFLQERELWVLPPSAELIYAGPGRTPAITLEQSDDKVLAELRQRLQSVAKITNLLRLASLNLGKPSPVPLSTTVRIRKRDGSESVFRRDNVPALHHGDRLFVTLSNTGDKPIDATVLFVDGQYGLQTIFPAPGETNRVQKGESASFGMEIITRTETEQVIAVGRERLIVIVTEGTGRYPASFAFLARDKLQPTRSSADRMGYRDIYKMLELAGFSQLATRSAVQLESHSLDRVRFEIFAWDSLIE